ncbi:MAG: O-antigen ligase family protein [Melioribacteraceae bacterium]|nr:O-antigen ligase family protein [Melioribacteraceae bacterium]
MIFATGLDQASQIGGGVTLFHLGWFMGILTLVFYQLIYQKKIRYIFPFTKYFIAFIVIILISLTYSPNYAEGLYVVFQSLALYVFFILVANFVNTKEHFITIALVLLGINIFQTFLLIYQLIFENVTYFAESTIESDGGIRIYRPSGTFEDPNVLAFYMIPGIFYSASLIMFYFKNKMINILLGLGIAISLLGTILTFSRSGWLSLIAGIFTLALFHANRKQVFSFIIGIGIIIILILLNSEYGELVFSRFASIFDLLKDPSTAVRIGLMKSGIAMFLDNPFFGVGYRGFPVLYDLYIDPIVPQEVLYVKESHTLWTTLIAELSIWGVLIVLFWFRRIFKDLRLRLKSNDSLTKAIIIGSFATFIAFNMQFILYGLFPHLNLIWLVFGLIYCFENISEKSTSINNE